MSIGALFLKCDRLNALAYYSFIATSLKFVTVVGDAEAACSHRR